MFTGIVKEIGKIKALVKTLMGLQFFIACKSILEGLKIGDSIAVNGTCLTVTKFNEEGFYAEAVAETLRCTNLGGLKEQACVNLEPAMTLQDRIGGHLMQGHVDGVGEIIQILEEGDSRLMSIRFPQVLRPYLIKKGFIGMDGMSITLSAVEDDIFQVALVPHTLQHTIAGHYREGSRVNLEVDMMAKYVENFISKSTSHRHN